MENVPLMRNKANEKKRNKIIKTYPWLLTLEIRSKPKEEKKTVCYCVKQLLDIIMKAKQTEKEKNNRRKIVTIILKKMKKIMVF